MWSRGRVDHIIDLLSPYRYAASMAERVRKVTVNVPADLLDDAIRITAKGITPTIVEGLNEIRRRAKRSALRQLRGKVRFQLDLETTRR
jgi:hypothetical protein